jgi:membrane protease subunit HflK
MIRLAPLVVFGLLLLYVLWHGFYTVAAHEKAVVLRFGKFRSTEGPGLHYKIPLVDEAVLVETDEKSLALPFGLRGASRDINPNMTTERQGEPLILTGDLYAGIVEWNVIWRVAEPKNYLFSIAAGDVEDTIIAVARSVMHRVVGDYSADEILTGKREEIGLAAEREMQQVMDSYECGVRIVGLQMQRVTPPERVKPAFDEVNASIQQKEQLVNEANRERNRLIPQAEADANKLEQQAEGYAARRRAEAEGEIAALLAKYNAYKQAPDVTRQRMYLETMEDVIAASGPKTVLDGDLRGLLPFLNLNGEEGPVVQPRKEGTK